jgi:1-phosphatidylinositol-3-phosphate 5-kinase
MWCKFLLKFHNLCRTICCHLCRLQGSGYMNMEERCRVLQKSASLRALFEDMCHPNVGLALQTHRYRLRSYHRCFLGSELVDWLLTQGHAATR